MSQLRIIYDNAADNATLTASSTAGSLVASNMKSNIKSRVWRSTSTSAILTMYLDRDETVNAVILAFTNMTPSAVIRVSGTDSNNNVVFESQPILSNPPAPLGFFEWGDTLAENAYSGILPLSVNNFSQGRYSYARIWLENSYTVRNLFIEITDTFNSAGYIEVGKLIAGKYWSPAVGTEVGATEVLSEDSSTLFRSEAGDLWADQGSKHRVISLNLPSLDPVERDKTWQMLRNKSKGLPVLVSAFSNDEDSALEQMFMIFGNISNTAAMGIPYSKKFFETNIEIEEI